MAGDREGDKVQDAGRSDDFKTTSAGRPRTVPRARKRATNDEGVKLLAAVCARPHDDAARLAFADWLARNGQPERAELIRVEIDMFKKGESLSDHSSNLFVSLDRGESSARASPWKADLPPLKGVTWGTLTERGFFHGAEFAGLKAVHENAGAVRAAVPLTSVTLKRMTSEAARAVAGMPWLGQLTHLNLSGPIGPDGFAAVCASPHLERLEWLWVENGSVGDRGMAVIARALGLPNLRSLTIKKDEVTLRGVRSLLASRTLTRLEAVNGLGQSRVKSRETGQGLWLLMVQRNLMDEFKQRFPKSWWS
jgi:uncharacterized protein (TIGR02996 family)